MQLAPIRSSTTPKTEATPFEGVREHVAIGHWTAPHGAPSYVAGWWTAGANLAPNGGWATQMDAHEGARLLSRTSAGPIAVTIAFRDPDPAAGRRYQAHRLATSEPTTSEQGWADRPDQWLTSDMLRGPQFRGFTVASFALGGIFDRGVQLAAGRRD